MTTDESLIAEIDTRIKALEWNISMISASKMRQEVAWIIHAILASKLETYEKLDVYMKDLSIILSGEA